MAQVSTIHAESADGTKFRFSLCDVAYSHEPEEIVTV